MKRCEHDWLPLVTATPPPKTDEGARLRFGFALGMSGLVRYDRCTKCGRLSWITKYRRKRSLVSCEFTAKRLIESAAEFDQWAKSEQANEERPPT
jgi:hypothetical protein